MIRVIVDHTTKSQEDADHLIQVIADLRNEAMKQPGYVTGETLINSLDPTNILVISTWKNAETWDAWDKSEERRRITREMMLPLLSQPYRISKFEFLHIQRGRVVSIT